MKKVFSVLMCAILLSSSLFAQTVSIDGVKGGKFTGVSAIKSGETGPVEGYFTYYMVDKGQKGMRTIEFAFIDKGVKNVVKSKIELHKRAYIGDVVFNGQYIVVVYNDTKAKQIVTTLLDKNGKVVTKKKVAAAKARFGMVGSKTYADNTGKGFYLVMPLEKGRGYSIEKMDNNLKTIWKINDKVAKGRKSVADLISTDDNVVVWQEFSPKGRLIKPQIVCYDAKTGAEKFIVGGYDGVSTILYNKLKFDDKGNLYAAGAYVDGEKIKSANISGIYLMKIDAKGKKVLYNKVGSTEKIDAVVKASSSGFSVGSKDKIFVEDLIFDNNNIIIVSEAFRLNLNMTPTALQQTRDMITGKFIGAPTDDNKTKQTFEILDYILFSFNQEGKLGEIKVLNKEKTNKINCWAPYSRMRAMQLAKVMKNFGWFDYSFTTKNSAGQTLLVCKNNAEARKPQVFVYSLDPKDMYAKVEINLKEQAKMDLKKGKVGYFDTFENTRGKVAVGYYQRKLKVVTISLESIE